MQEINNIWVFRMIAIDNLENDLTNGLFSKMNAPIDPNRTVIGNAEIISERDRRSVICYPGTFVNNYVPFYFSVRTPMLLNIHTGHGVPQIHQSNIVYLGSPLVEVATDDLQWCYTNGNAAKLITRYFTSLDDINLIDWRSILTEDFRHDNSDGDEDRIRKKHAEFLIKDYVPKDRIKGIAVFNQDAANNVNAILQRIGSEIVVKIKRDFYF